ncbi:hypothetical protein ACGFR8_07795 [Streptomyces brevispora]|uniref:hypothetical protein n=1 Tax=Streptomyces brevispora TaxID=887462 RepID=UPI0037239B57
MADLTARIVARVHQGLGDAAHRLTAGQTVMVEAAAGAVWPRRVHQPAPEAPAEKSAEPTDAAPAKATEAKATEAKAAPQKTGKAKGKGKAPADPTDQPKAPPPHTTYRPGPRRALAAAWHWTSSGEGAGDVMLRAGLLALALGIVGYFARSYLEEIQPAVLAAAAVIVVVYEIAPRLSLLLALGLAAVLIHPAWLGLAAVVLLAAELAPTIAALLGVALVVGLIHPALMWPVVLAWGMAAWQVGAPNDQPAPETETPPAAEPPAAEPPAEAPRTHLLRWLDHLTQDASGIHLDQLHAALTAHPDLAGLTRAQMRVWLNRHEIPVERTLRVGLIPGRSGIARTTVTALLQAPSQTLPSPVESAVESAPLHVSDLQESPHSPGVESGVESGVERHPAHVAELAGTAPELLETAPAPAHALYT